MPNQRSKNKVLLGAFVDRELKAALLAIAQARGLTASAAIIAAIHEYVTYAGNVLNVAIGSGPTIRPSDGPQSPPGANTIVPAQTSSTSTVEEVWLL
jgi:hypothetical protein